MATTKPRITVTLTHRQHEVLKTISDCGGQSMSTFISDMLELSLPTLERMAATFQKIKRAQDQQRETIRDALDDAQAALEPIALHAVGQFDLFMAKLEQASGVDATDARERVGAATPDAHPAPATNRGATPRKETAGVPSPARISSRSHGLGKSKDKGMPTS